MLEHMRSNKKCIELQAAAVEQHRLQRIKEDDDDWFRLRDAAVTKCFHLIPAV